MGRSLTTSADALVADTFTVGEGEEVLITADTDTAPEVAAAIMDSALRCGARASVMTLPRLPFQGLLADPYLPAALAGAAMAADVWIDLTFPYIAGAKLHDEVMKAGKARYLLLGDVGPDNLARLYGRADFDRYFDAQLAFDRLFEDAIGKRCRITNPAGSDVGFTLGKSSLNKPRRAQAPGMYLVPGTCSIAPDIESVRGTIVIGAVFHEFYEKLSEPIRIEVDGRIKSVSGSGAPGIAFERALGRAAREGRGSIIHFSHGLHPATRFTGSCFIEDIRVMGNNAIGFGLPWWEPGGGENHPDGVMTAHSVWIEDDKVIEDGRIVWPPALAAKAEALAPLA